MISRLESCEILLEQVLDTICLHFDESCRHSKDAFGTNIDVTLLSDNSFRAVIESWEYSSSYRTWLFSRGESHENSSLVVWRLFTSAIALVASAIQAPVDEREFCPLLVEAISSSHSRLELCSVALKRWLQSVSSAVFIDSEVVEVRLKGNFDTQCSQVLQETYES